MSVLQLKLFDDACQAECNHVMMTTVQFFAGCCLPTTYHGRMA